MTKPKYTKIKRRLNFLREFLPIAIIGEAKSIERPDVEPGENFATQQADDEFLIVSTDSPKIYKKWGAS